MKSKKIKQTGVFSLLVIVFLLFAGKDAFSQNPPDTTLFGTWNGWVYDDPSSPEPYEISLKIMDLTPNQNSGSIVYAGGICTSAITFIENNSGFHVFDETLLSGPCYDSGGVKIFKINDCSLQWYWYYTKEDTIPVCSAVISQVETSITKQSATTLIANFSGATYQWLDCNDGYSVIQGETGQSFTATENGSYAVEITKNNCVDTSDCYNITTLGISSNRSGNEIKIYPNPAQTTITITSQSSLLIEIIDVTGKTHMVSNSSTVDISSLSPGIYFAKLKDQNGNTIKVEQLRIQ